MSERFADVDDKAPFGVNRASAKVSLLSGDINRIFGVKPEPIIKPDFSYMKVVLLGYDHRL